MIGTGIYLLLKVCHSINNIYTGYSKCSRTTGYVMIQIALSLHDEPCHVENLPEVALISDELQLLVFNMIRKKKQRATFYFKLFQLTTEIYKIVEFINGENDTP